MENSKEKNVRTLLEASGYRIPPYRLAQMSKTVSKMMDLLTCNPACSYSATEVHYMLRVTNEMIASGEKDIWN